jgi:hypothetical protein
METTGVDGNKAVSPLRQRMIRDMGLAGFTPGTQKRYVAAVLALAKHYGGKRPELMTEEEVYRYILWLRDEQGVAQGTFKQAFAALKFLFFRTLDRDWALFSKKRFGRHCRSGCRGRSQGMNAAA